MKRVSDRPQIFKSENHIIYVVHSMEQVVRGHTRYAVHSREWVNLRRCVTQQCQGAVLGSYFKFVSDAQHKYNLLLCLLVMESKNCFATSVSFLEKQNLHLCLWKRLYGLTNLFFVVCFSVNLENNNLSSLSGLTTLVNLRVSFMSFID